MAPAVVATLSVGMVFAVMAIMVGWCILVERFVRHDGWRLAAILLPLAIIAWLGIYLEAAGL